MQPQKIDQQQTYPCVCTKQGKLKPILLTDAFGCDRCASIFVVDETNHTLTQVDGIDPYQRAWFWQGSAWRQCRNGSSKSSVRFLSPGTSRSMQGRLWLGVSLGVVFITISFWLVPTLAVWIAGGLGVLLILLMFMFSMR